MKKYALVRGSEVLWQGEDYFAARRAEKENQDAEFIEYEAEYDENKAEVRITLNGDTRSEWYAVPYKGDDILQAFEYVKTKEYKGDIAALAYRVSLSEAEAMIPDDDKPTFPYSFARMFKELPFAGNLGIDVDIAEAIYDDILDMAERLREFHIDEGDI